MNKNTEKKDAEPSVSKNFLEPRIYGSESIRLNNGAWKLKIEINHHTFLLPLINVGSQEKPIRIAWFDPNPAQNPVLAQAAAQEMATLIERLEPRFVFTPASSKSNYFVREAVIIASQGLSRPVGLEILLGSKSRQEVVDQAGSEELVLSYNPVTSLTEPKYMGLSQDHVYYLRTFCTGGRGLLFVDDVRTTGSTALTFQNLARRVLKTSEDQPFPEAMVAAESVYGPNYPDHLPSHVLTFIHLPEFVGALPV